MMFFDPMYFIIIAPAVLLGLWAQMKVKSQYAAASKVGSNLSGAAAARRILDYAGLQDVAIEPIRGQLTDHYDPRDKVLRLSEGVYGENSMAAVGIAAHEAGHALQDAKSYTPLVLRNMAVPAASFGSSAGMLLIFAGFGLAYAQFAASKYLILAGIIGFACVAAFQLINLPVEFDASNRAKKLIVEHGMVPAGQMGAINGVLNAAAWTYVAATLQSVLILLYYVMRFGGLSDD